MGARKVPAKGLPARASLVILHYVCWTAAQGLPLPPLGGGDTGVTNSRTSAIGRERTASCVSPRAATPQVVAPTDPKAPTAPSQAPAPSFKQLTPTAPTSTPSPRTLQSPALRPLALPPPSPKYQQPPQFSISPPKPPPSAFPRPLPPRSSLRPPTPAPTLRQTPPPSRSPNLSPPPASARRPPPPNLFYPPPSRWVPPPSPGWRPLAPPPLRPPFPLSPPPLTPPKPPPSPPPPQPPSPPRPSPPFPPSSLPPRPPSPPPPSPSSPPPRRASPPPSSPPPRRASPPPSSPPPSPPPPPTPPPPQPPSRRPPPSTPPPSSSSLVSGLCFEKVSSKSAIFLAEHPAGGKLVVAKQDGRIYLLQRPAVLGGVKEAPVLSTFLDISSHVLYQGERGLLGFAFHPDFLTNGRFFASFICNSTVHSGCMAPCDCTTERGCISPPTDCPSTTVIAEYWAGPNPKSALQINATEVRKVLKIGRPFSNHNGGQIWFGSDSYLYFASGDGGFPKWTGDPLMAAQNGQTLLGKILRLNVHLASGMQRGYVVPQDNPFVGVAGVRPEIYALGLRNPWRCSEDPPTRTLLCGDVGQDTSEEVNIVTAGGNYGWSYLEGTTIYKRGTPAHPIGGKFTPPVLEHPHPTGAADAGRAVVGGIVYRAQRNKCLQGLYVHNDVYGLFYVASLVRLGAPANYSTVVPVACAPGSTCDLNGWLWSWGADLSGELYVMGQRGIHRLVDGAACGIRC